MLGRITCESGLFQRLLFLFGLKFLITLCAAKIVGRNAYEVIQLDISVHEARFVERLNAQEHLQGYLVRGLLIEVPPLAFVHQAHDVAAEQFGHDEKAVILPVKTTVEEFEKPYPCVLRLADFSEYLDLSLVGSLMLTLNLY